MVPSLTPFLLTATHRAFSIEGSIYQSSSQETDRDSTPGR
jgi:hypothetical protein